MPLQLGFVVEQAMLGECFLSVLNVSTNVASKFPLRFLPFLGQLSFVAAYCGMCASSYALFELLSTFKASVLPSNQSFGAWDFPHKLIQSRRISFLLQLQL